MVCRFVKGMRAAADALETAAGSSKIDYLVSRSSGKLFDGAR